MILHLNLKGEYFDAIKAGTKQYEYRECTEYWQKRLQGKEFDGIVLKRGYPSSDDTSKILKRPWRGWVVRTICHPHFGDKPVTVFAIRVN